MAVFKELEDKKGYLTGVKITPNIRLNIVSVIPEPDYSAICRNYDGERTTNDKNKNFDNLGHTNTPHTPFAKELRYALQNLY
ncbi:MAG: hypothetical protein WC501_01195 [Candidatus Micrarchaeia archaeon]|jgi:hypothetical protein